MLYCAIVEDEQEDLVALRKCLTQYAQENEISFHVECFSDALDFLERFHSQYDIVFLDIELPNITGMEAARRLRSQDPDVTLVFVTNMQQYAVQGYEVAAFDYILKPVTYYAFSLKLRRIVSYALSRDKSQSTMIRVEGKTIRIPYRSILYLEADGHYLVWHTEQQVYRVLGSMKAVQETLPDTFFPISRWNLINLQNVTSVQGYNVTLGEETLQISRYKLKEFQQAFAMFMVGG